MINPLTDNEGFFEKEVSALTAQYPSAVDHGLIKRGILSIYTGVAILHADVADDVKRILSPADGCLYSVTKLEALHDIRLILLENNTKLLLSMTFDGSFENLIHQMKDKTPQMMDIVFAGVQGWPGIRSEEVVDFLRSIQIAVGGWYAANTSQTVHEMKRNQAVINSVVDVIRLTTAFE